MKRSMAHTCCLGAAAVLAASLAGCTKSYEFRFQNGSAEPVAVRVRRLGKSDAAGVVPPRRMLRYALTIREKKLPAEVTVDAAGRTRSFTLYGSEDRAKPFYFMIEPRRITGPSRAPIRWPGEE